MNPFSLFISIIFNDGYPCGGAGGEGGGEEEEGPSASIELNLGSLISRRIFQDFSGFFRIFQDFSGFFGIFRDYVRQGFCV